MPSRALNTSPKLPPQLQAIAGGRRIDWPAVDDSSDGRAA